MSATLDHAIRFIILTAKDDADAKRTLVGFEPEIRNFYLRTFHYPLEEEFAFRRLGYQCRQAAADEKALFVGQMMQMIQKLWYGKHEHDPSGKGKELYAHSVFEEIDKLRLAAVENNEEMCGYRLDYLCGSSSDENAFRKFLAELNDTDLWKIDHFEEYLIGLIGSIRYLNEIESGKYKAPNDLDQLGLDSAKEYLNDTVPEIRMAWMTDLILLLLFDALILAGKISLRKAGVFVRFRARKDVALWLTNLMIFRNEIASRCYDASEMIRRLRSFEDAKGTYVIPSLVYPLLELQVLK